MATRKKKTEAVEVEAEEPGRGGSRAFWSGTLSFGLVTVPVELYPAQRSTRGSLRMLAADGTPLSRRYFRPGEDTPLEWDEIARGYELDGKLIEVTDEELESLLPEQSRDIDLRTFVPEESIHPFQLDRSYFMAPTGKSTLAYRLLADVIAHTRKAGIATFVMRGKQYVVAIVAEEGLLRAETLRFSEELRAPADIGLPSDVEPDPKEVQHMRAAIKPLKKSDVAMSDLEDHYWKDLEKLVEAKRKKDQDVVSPKAAEGGSSQGGDIIDLVAILRRSLNQSADNDTKAPKRKTSSTSRTRKRPAAKAATKTRKKASASTR
jgi:DNA end-binding protein Ku